jgi:hypothetical protein
LASGGEDAAVSDDRGYILFVSQQPNDGTLVLLRLDIDSDVTQLVEGFKQFALGAGYPVNAINAALGEDE